MPWNEPGGNGKNNDPWGSNKNNPSPPDLDKILSDFLKKVRQFTSFFNKGNGGPRPSSSGTSNHRYGITAAFLVFFGIWIVSGFYIINPAEQAVILRFGKFADVEQPGLHWMARFIDTKYVIDVQKVYSFSLQGDFITKSSDQGDLAQYVAVPGQTGQGNISDLSKNLVNVELTVQYRVSDPTAYLFNVVNPDETVRQVATGALSDIIGKMKLDDVLTTGRELLSSSVLDSARAVLQRYNAGVEVSAVTLRRIQAPDQVRAAFNDVNRADQDKATYIQQAQAYASKVVPIAQGNASRIIADANGYQQQIVLNAQASVARYQAMLHAYISAPEVTRQRMYLETMQGVFDRTTKILVDVNASNNMMYLPLEKLLQQNKTPAEEPLPSASNNTADAGVKNGSN